LVGSPELHYFRCALCGSTDCRDAYSACMSSAGECNSSAPEHEQPSQRNDSVQNVMLARGEPFPCDGFWQWFRK
jgi:hypothetical protein